MSEQLFNLPASNREKFVRHFLSNVACELAFTSGTMDALESNIQPIKEDMSSIGFTENKEIIESSVSFEANTDSKQPAKVEQTIKPTGYSFRNVKEGLTCNILADKIVLSTTNYTGFEDFHCLLEKIITHVNQRLGNRGVIKTSLKKVNSIVMESVTLYEEVCSIFNPAIFALLRSGLPTSNVKVAQEVLILETASSASLLRNTFRALEANNSYEASLDFDVVNRDKLTVEEALNTTIKELNQIHFDLFKWAVTSKMLSLMNQEED